MHVPGSKIVLADALSRPFPEPDPAPGPVSVPTASSLVSPSLPSLPQLLSALPPQVLSNPALSTYDFHSFSALQQTCLSVSEMGYSPSLSLVFVPFGAFSLLCDVSSGSLCPLVPLELR